MAVSLAKKQLKKFDGVIKVVDNRGGREPKYFNINSQEVYSAVEILHGLYCLEMFDKWSENPNFRAFYELVRAKADTAIDSVVRLRYPTIKENYDWEWSN